MIKYPSISLITPVLNESATLHETLDSVLRQTVPPYSHIIVDSGSTDGSLQIIDEYMRRAPYPVHLLRTPPEGVYAALNAGGDMAKGTLIGLLHGDDAFSSPQVLEFVASAMANNPSCQLVYGDVHYVDVRGRRTRYYSGAHFKPTTLLHGFAFPHPSMYIRRELWKSIGHYDVQLKIAADYDWIVRATLVHRTSIMYLPLDMVAMHEGGLASRWRNRLLRNNPEKLRALRKNGFPASLWRLLMRYSYLFRH